MGCDKFIDEQGSRSMFPSEFNGLGERHDCYKFIEFTVEYQNHSSSSNISESSLESCGRSGRGNGNIIQTHWSTTTGWARTSIFCLIMQNCKHSCGKYISESRARAAGKIKKLRELSGEKKNLVERQVTIGNNDRIEREHTRWTPFTLHESSVND